MTDKKVKFIDMEPKPYSKNNKIFVPKKLKKVKQTDKPTIDIPLLDRLWWWLNSQLSLLIDKVVVKIVPNYFWIAILIILVVFLLIKF